MEHSLDPLTKGKTSKPFVYLSLTMPGGNIDVNVHPTKLEVQFLHEEKINDLIQKEFDKILARGADERTMKFAPSFFNSSETSINLDVSAVSSQSWGFVLFCDEKLR